MLQPSSTPEQFNQVWHPNSFVIAELCFSDVRSEQILPADRISHVRNRITRNSISWNRISLVVVVGVFLILLMGPWAVVIGPRNSFQLQRCQLNFSVVSGLVLYAADFVIRIAHAASGDQPSPTRFLPPAANNHHGAADGDGATRRFDPDDVSIVTVGARTFRCEIIARPRPIQSWSCKRHFCGWLFQSGVRMRRDRDQDQILTWTKMTRRYPITFFS